MTTKLAQTGTVEEAYLAIRDELTTMTEWSLKDESINTAGQFRANNNPSDYFVLTAPSGEDIRIQASSNNSNDVDGIRFEYGPNWDSANTTWGDRYSGDPSSSNNTGTLCPVSSSFAGFQYDVQWWVTYENGTGWVFVISGEDSDENNKMQWLGMAQVDQLWDYDTAAARESDYCYLWYGAEEFNMQGPVKNGTGMGRQSGATNHARGRPNGDANFNDFPIQKNNVVASDNYSGTLIGTHQVWFFPDENTDGDTVKDSNNNILYHTIQKNNGSNDTPKPLGIRKF